MTTTNDDAVTGKTTSAAGHEATSATVTLLGIAGSLRRASKSRALLLSATSLVGEGTRLIPHSIDDVPLYNGDLDVDGGPPSVRALKEAIARADGVLLVTPEYNYSVPGVLKNAIDWASRPAYRSVFLHKPVAIVGLANSLVGGARAVGQLKQVLLGLCAEVYPAPEMLVPRVNEKIDDEGRLTDEETRTRLTRLLAEFSSWIERRRGFESVPLTKS